MVPTTMLGIALEVALLDMRTSLQLNCDCFVRAFHQEPTMPVSQVRAGAAFGRECSARSEGCFAPGRMGGLPDELHDRGEAPSRKRFQVMGEPSLRVIARNWRSEWFSRPWLLTKLPAEVETQSA